MKSEIYCMRIIPVYTAAGAAGHPVSAAAYSSERKECNTRMDVVECVNMKARLRCKKCNNEVIFHA